MSKPRNGLGLVSAWSVAALVACSSASPMPFAGSASAIVRELSQASPNSRPSNEIYVVNTTGETIETFKPGPRGEVNEPPTSVIGGNYTSLYAPDAIAVDDSGRIYSTTAPPQYGAAIVMFGANPPKNLNKPPIGTIEGDNTGLFPSFGIEVDAKNRIYAANMFPQNILVFAADPKGVRNEKPVATIGGSNTKLAGPLGLALDKQGRIYISNFSGPSVTVYHSDPIGNKNEAPLATITGTKTGLQSPTGIAVDAKGRIYVGSSINATASVRVFSADPSGTLNEAPIAVISGNKTQLLSTFGIAIDGSGRIYVADAEANAVDVFAANPKGNLNEAPIARIFGEKTQLDAPVGVTIH